MIKDTKCRYCKKTLHVKVDPAIEELGLDRLLGTMASCDRCAAFREKRRTLLEHLKNICETIHIRGHNPKDADTRDVVTQLLQRYIALVAAYKSMTPPAWEESITDALLRSPMQYQEVINNLSRMCSEPQLL